MFLLLLLLWVVVMVWLISSTFLSLVKRNSTGARRGFLETASRHAAVSCTESASRNASDEQTIKSVGDQHLFSEAAQTEHVLAARNAAGPASAGSDSLNPNQVLLSAALAHELPTVSILKPLKGAEFGLRENLISFFTLSYPRDRYEVVVSASEEDDEGLAIAREVARQFPEVACRLIVTGCACGCRDGPAGLKAAARSTATSGSSSSASFNVSGASLCGPSSGGSNGTSAGSIGGNCSAGNRSSNGSSSSGSSSSSSSSSSNNNNNNNSCNNCNGGSGNTDAAAAASSAAPCSCASKIGSFHLGSSSLSPVGGGSSGTGSNSIGNRGDGESFCMSELEGSDRHSIGGGDGLCMGSGSIHLTMVSNVASALKPAGSLAFAGAALASQAGGARISCAEEGLNPKVTNLIPGYESSKMDLILISDSNIRVDKHYLTDLVVTMPKGCSLVSSLVAGRCSQKGRESLFPSLGGALESLTLNAFVTRWISLSSAVGLVPVVGKSILIDRRSLNELGGLRAFSCYADEDFLMGERLRLAGRLVSLSPVTVTQVLGPNVTLRSFLVRHSRWGRIRNAVSLGHLESKWNPTPLSLGTLVQEVLFNAHGAAACLYLGLSSLSACSSSPVTVMTTDSAAAVMSAAASFGSTASAMTTAASVGAAAAMSAAATVGTAASTVAGVVAGASMMEEIAALDAVITACSAPLTRAMIILAHYVVWGLCDIAMVAKSDPEWTSIIAAALLWPVRELAAVVLWYCY